MRKLLFLAVMLVAFCAAIGRAQNQPNIIESWWPSQPAGTNTVGDGAPLNVRNYGAVTFEVIGTFTGTILPKVKASSTYQTIQVWDVLGNPYTTGVTSPGIYYGITGSCEFFIARVDSISSGSVAVNTKQSRGVISRLPASGGGGGSGITQLTGDIVAGPGTGSQTATLPNIVTPATQPKVTYNAKGQITSGGPLASGDVTAALGFTPENPLTFNLPLNRSINAISITKADATHDGYLAQGDWSTFNGKQNALGFTPENVANRGAASGYAPLDANSLVPVANLPALVFSFKTRTGTVVPASGDYLASQVTNAVDKTASNTYTGGDQDLSAAASLKIPSGASLQPTVNARIAYDSTANRFGGAVNGAYALFVHPASIDVFTNKTYDTVGTGNVFKINGAQVSSIGSGLSISAGILSASGGSGGTPAGSPNDIQINNTVFGADTGKFAWDLVNHNLTAKVSDAATNTVSVIANWYHNTTGTPAANYGIRHQENLDTTTTPGRPASATDTIWTNPADGSRSAAIVFNLVDNAAPLAEVARLTGTNGLTEKIQVGNAKIGRWSASSSFAIFVNKDVSNETTQYALVQQNNGDTFLNTGGTLNFNVQSGNHATLTLSGWSWNDPFVKYNNIATAGWGVPAIYKDGRQTGQTGVVGSLVSYTVGGADGSFYVSGEIEMTAFTAGTVSMTCTYTDPGGIVRTATLNFENVGGTIMSTAGAVGVFEGFPNHIRAKASTSITLATTVTAFTGTYNVEGVIMQIR